MPLLGPYNLIIPQGVKQNSSDVFAVLDPDSGGAATFAAPLSADGSAPATHWGTRTWLEEATHNALATMTTTEFKTYVDQVAATRERAPVGSITAFKNALLMGEGNFWTFAASHGLQAVAVEE